MAAALFDKLNLDNVIIVGDRLLVKPKTKQDKTQSGIYLPPGVSEREKIHSGYVIKVGPGYPIPSMTDYEEPWQKKDEKVKYVPLQAEIGDLAIYLQSNSFDIQINGQSYVLLPNSAVLMLFRDEDLFK